MLKNFEKKLFGEIKSRKCLKEEQKVIEEEESGRNRKRKKKRSYCFSTAEFVRPAARRRRSPSLRRPARISPRGIHPCALLAPGSSPPAARRCCPGEPAAGRKPLLLPGSASLLPPGARRQGRAHPAVRRSHALVVGGELRLEQEWISGGKKEKEKGRREESCDP